MEANELRIGNFVNGVNGIDFCVGWEELRDLQKGFNELNPIPLTEEWLVKFGLIKVKNIDTYSIWMFSDINFTYETERNFVMLGCKIISRCKYVHQLQNLYFALTGQELTTPQ